MIKCTLTQCDGTQKVLLVQRDAIATVREYVYTGDSDLGHAKVYTCIITLLNGKQVWLDGTLSDFMALWRSSSGGLYMVLWRSSSGGLYGV